MKKLLGVVVFVLLSSNLAFGATYFFKNCDDQASATRTTATIDLDLKKAHTYSTDNSTGQILLDGTAPLKTISESKIVTVKTSWKSLYSKSSKFSRDERILIDVVQQIETYYPKQKKVVTTMIVPNIYDKKIKKKLKKFGVPHFPWERTTTSYCQSVESEGIVASKPKKKESKKEKPTPTPDDNKVVPAGSGSGFFVSRNGHIITNYHVIEGCDLTKVSFKGNQVEAKILAVDKMNDIAILKSNIKPNNVFPISNEDVSLLEDVVVAGYPLGKQVSSAIKTHKGVVTALAGAGDNYSNFQTDATINAGNSGGPIMNQKGNIVGIAVQTWVEEGVQGIHFGIKSSTLKTFASSNNLTFIQPNNRELSNKDLGKLITEATVYLECHMTIAKIKKMIAQADNRKAFFSEYK